MGRYAARRIADHPGLLRGDVPLFAMVWALPGDPIRALSGDKPPPPAVYEQLREQYNLDDPLIIQYLKYMAGLFQGDFGTSFRGQEVSAIMADAWPVTVSWPSRLSSSKSSSGCPLAFWPPAQGQLHRQPGAD